MFPHLFAAWLATRSAARRGLMHVNPSRVKQALAAGSAWTTALLAGGLALLLTVILAFLDPPPDAALSSQPPQHSPPQSLRSAPAESPLRLDVVRLVSAAGDERALEAWTSIVPEPPPSVPIPDRWSRAQPRSQIAASSEPYYLRAEFVELDQLAAALSSRDEPQAGADSQVDRDIRVFIERSAACADESGTLVYSLHVHNDGPELLEHVRVVETLPHAEHVVETSPPALMTPGGALVWQLAALQPQEARELTIRLDAAAVSEPFETAAALEVESQLAVRTAVAAVSGSGPDEPPVVLEPVIPDGLHAPLEPSLPEWPALADEPTPFWPDDLVLPESPIPEEGTVPAEPFLTDETPRDWPDVAQPAVPKSPVIEPEPVDQSDPPPIWAPTPRPLPLEASPSPRPVLSLAVQATETARTGEIVTTIYEIANTGDAPAEAVVLTVHVPRELRHRHGELVEHRIERLAPGESRSARLYTRASAVGVAKLDAVLSHNGLDSDAQVVSVRVVEPRPPDSRSGPPSQPPR